MLTYQYLIDHAESTKTGSKSDYEAFGRAVAELLLRSGAQSPSLQGGGADVVSMIATIRLAKYEPMVCADAEVCTPFGCVKGHIGI